MAVNSQTISPPQKKRAGVIQQREIKYGWIFASPAVIFFSLFYLYPLGRGVIH